MFQTATAIDRHLDADEGLHSSSHPSGLTRWVTAKGQSTHSLIAQPGHHLISVVLRATRLSLRLDTAPTFDGTLRAGAVHVTRRALHARLDAPCDILHFQVPTYLLRDRLAALGAQPGALDELEGSFAGDLLMEQLARLLISEAAQLDPVYRTALTQTLVTRILQSAQTKTSAGALVKWRLLRVQSVIEARFTEPLRLRDLAAAAGLSRMHFAAQFRAATGSSPHEYLLCRRIEAAKTMMAETETSLAEIALNVGFQAQTHFTTVFKRLTATTPAQWRRSCREAAFPNIAPPTIAPL